MSGEVSYFSRVFVKFVEIIAAGLASAICAYLLAHFGGLLSRVLSIGQQMRRGCGVSFHQQRT
jgi:hypothetical protein